MLISLVRLSSFLLYMQPGVFGSIPRNYVRQVTSTLSLLGGLHTCAVVTHRVFCTCLGSKHLSSQGALLEMVQMRWQSMPCAIKLLSKGAAKQEGGFVTCQTLEACQRTIEIPEDQQLTPSFVFWLVKSFSSIQRPGLPLATLTPSDGMP